MVFGYTYKSIRNGMPTGSVERNGEKGYGVWRTEGLYTGNSKEALILWECNEKEMVNPQQRSEKASIINIIGS